MGIVNQGKEFKHVLWDKSSLHRKLHPMHDGATRNLHGRAANPSPKGQESGQAGRAAFPSATVTSQDNEPVGPAFPQPSSTTRA